MFMKKFAYIAACTLAVALLAWFALGTILLIVAGAPN
jgi:hypothetical protein